MDGLSPRLRPAGGIETGEAPLEAWTLAELDSYEGDAVFAPRSLPAMLQALLDGGVPAEPVAVGI